MKKKPPASALYHLSAFEAKRDREPEKEEENKARFKAMAHQEKKKQKSLKEMVSFWGHLSSNRKKNFCFLLPL